MESLPLYAWSSPEKRAPSRRGRHWHLQSASLHKTNPVAHMAVRGLYMLSALFIVIAVKHLSSLGEDGEAPVDAEQATSSAAFSERSHGTSSSSTRRNLQKHASVFVVPPTCDGKTFILACQAGHVIGSIDAAFYGRSNRDVCPHPEKDATENIRCSLETAAHVMAALCVGKAKCTPAGGYTSVISVDPCPGTYKYSSATYTCVPE